MSNATLQNFVVMLEKAFDKRSMHYADKATNGERTEESFLVFVGQRKGLKEAGAIARQILEGALDPGDEETDELQSMEE